MSKKSIFDEVKKELKTNGWCQGQYESKDGQHCLVGALNECYDPDSYGNIDEAIYDWRQISEALDRAVARKSKKRANRDNTIKWNDSKGRKFKDIIQVLDLAKELV